MKNKILLCLLTSFILLGINVFAAEHIYDTSSVECSVTGELRESGYIGYNSKPAFSLNAEDGKVIWKMRLQEAVYYNVYVWKTLSEDACADAMVSYTSETQQKVEIPFNMQEGNAGWQLIGCYNMMGAGGTLEIYGTSGEMLISAIKFEEVGAEYAIVSKLSNADKSAVVLKVDGSSAIVGGAKKPVPDAVPTVINGRTLVPVRFITESIGAEVVWDEASRSATVTSDGKTIVFSLEKTEYTVDGITKQLDQPPLTINDRMMLPLRALSEEIGRKVFWDDSGLIVISKEDVSGLLDKAGVEDLIKVLK